MLKIHWTIESKSKIDCYFDLLIISSIYDFSLPAECVQCILVVTDEKMVSMILLLMWSTWIT